MFTHADDQDFRIDLRALAAIGRAGKWWVLGGALLFGGLALVYAFTATRVYRAEALVSVVQDAGGGLTTGTGNTLGALASLAGLDLTGTRGRRAEYIALLSSRALLSEFIAEENLSPVLFASEWDSARSTWRGEAPSVDDAVHFFRRKILTVADDRRTALVTVRIEWYDPKISADWANGLVALVNEQARQQAIEEAKRGIDFLNRELRTIDTVSVQQASYQLMETHLNRIMLASVQPQYALRAIDPAVPPDPDRFVHPTPLLEVPIAAILGALLGLGIAYWRRPLTVTSSATRRG